MEIKIDKQLQETFPNLMIGIILSKSEVFPADEFVKSEMDKIAAALSPNLSPESIRRHPVIEATKNAYRRLGKDPNRYRPAAESLLRRLASGKGLYHVNNMVDILNLVSVQSGFSIGGYDADRILGKISFGIGKAEEPFVGIGRGVLNIENLPVFRDDAGAFGTSTSDSVRTMVIEETKQFLMVIPAFNGDEFHLKSALDLSEQLLVELGKVKELSVYLQGNNKD